MDYAFSVTTTAQMALLKGLHRHFTGAPQLLLLRCNLKRVVASYNGCRIPTSSSSVASAPPSPSLGAFRSLLPRTPCHPQCVLNSAASFASSAGGGNGGAGSGCGGGGGGSGGESGDGSLKLVGNAAQELSALSPDVIILDVAGMVCGGCAANVKRILESQPQVSSASVNLTTETAVVWPVSEAKTAPNWQKQLGEALAEHLTSCGFNSSLRGGWDVVSFQGQPCNKPQRGLTLVLTDDHPMKDHHQELNPRSLSPHRLPLPIEPTIIGSI